MLIRFYGDLSRLIHSLWNEERIERLMSSDWDELTRLRDAYSPKIDEAILFLNSLTKVEDCKKFVTTLSDTMHDLLLMELAIDIRELSGSIVVKQ